MVLPIPYYNLGAWVLSVLCNDLCPWHTQLSIPTWSHVTSAGFLEPAPGERQDPSGFCKRLSLTSSLDGSKCPTRSFLKVAQHLSVWASRSKSQKVKEGWRKWWINPGWMLENSQRWLSLCKDPGYPQEAEMLVWMLVSMVDSPADAWRQPPVFWDFFSPGKSVPAQFSRQTGGQCNTALCRLLLTNGSSPQGHMC